MEKDQKKSNLKLIFQENAQKCVQMTKKEKPEHVRRLSKRPEYTGEFKSCFLRITKFDQFLSN